MKIIVFGATGMVGQAVIKECLNDNRITEVLTIGRTPTEIAHPKLKEITHSNLWDYSSIENQLTGYDACLFCLGVSVGGISQDEYIRMNYDLPVAAATVLSKLNPQMRFIYVSGSGTDSTEKGRVFWARVKGRTENSILALPFKGAFMFRPGIIQPLNGVVSKTPAYRIFYTLSIPILPILKVLFPRSMITSVEMARAMIQVALNGYSQHLLETIDILKVARS